MLLAPNVVFLFLFVEMEVFEIEVQSVFLGVYYGHKRHLIFTFPRTIFRCHGIFHAAITKVVGATICWRYGGARSDSEARRKSCEVCLLAHAENNVGRSIQYLYHGVRRVIKHLTHVVCM